MRAKVTYSRQDKVVRLLRVQTVETGGTYVLETKFRVRYTSELEGKLDNSAHKIIFQVNVCGGIHFSTVFGLPIGGARVKASPRRKGLQRWNIDRANTQRN